MRRRISVFAVFWLATAAAAEPVAVPEVMSALASAKSSRASFVETKTSALLKGPVVSKGTLAYRRPDFLEKQVVSPYAERIVLSGETLTLQSGSRSATLTASSSPVLAALVQSMRAVRAGDLGALEKHFKVSVSGERERWSLVLTPAGTQLGDYVSQVTIAGAESRITAVDVQEPGGDRSVMLVHEQIE